MNALDVKLFRKKFAISQENLANILFVGLRTVQNYEKEGVIPGEKLKAFNLFKNKPELIDIILGNENQNIVSEPAFKYNTSQELELKEEILKLREEKQMLYKILNTLTGDIADLQQKINNYE